MRLTWCAERTDVKIIEITNVDFSLRHFLLPLMRGDARARPRGDRRLRRGPVARRRARAEGFRDRAAPVRPQRCRRWRIGAPSAPWCACSATERPDLVHAHMPISGFLARLAARCAGRAAHRLHVPRLPVQPARHPGRAAPSGFAMEWIGGPRHRRLPDRLDERGRATRAACTSPATPSRSATAATPPSSAPTPPPAPAHPRRTRRRRRTAW